MKVTFKPQLFFPFFLLALISGMFGGLIRMGWAFSFPQAAGYHGLLMTGCFMGSLITLERMVTMKSKWWMIFPTTCALAVPFVLTGKVTAGVILLMISSVGLVAFYCYHLWKYAETYWYILFSGSSFWLAGNIVFFQTESVPIALNWWVGFILLTILGERLELTKFLPVPKWEKQMLVALLVITCFGLVAGAHSHMTWVYPLGGLGLVFWFVRNDMARKSVKKSGYQRYLGFGILTAHFWLLLHFIGLLLFSENIAGYDIYIHTFFLGFGFSMIWAHAPMLLPALLKLPTKGYKPVIWIVWTGFQLSLFLRVLTAFLGFMEWKKWTSMANGILILLMFVSMVLIMVLGKKASNDKQIA